MTTVAIIAPGNMGAAVGHRLIEHGITVTTVLDGRSAASVERAERAGMKAVEEAALGESDFVLSILPPSEALALAERLAPVLTRAARKPVYVDCNAVSPDTVRQIAAVVARTGCAFVDAGIIGPPPQAGSKTTIYVAGADAGRFAALGHDQLRIHDLGGEIGAASAMKMSYSGIFKGFQALSTAMILAAGRAGSAEALASELAYSQPELLAWLTRQLPRMYSKAYRWTGEMEELSEFVAGVPGADDIYRGAARLYAHLARDYEAGGAEIERLEAFRRRKVDAAAG